jgi:predicted nucleic acid-binding protein
MTERATPPIVYLDSNIFIFGLEGSPDVFAQVQAIFAALRKRPGAAVTSELTLAEVLVGPEKQRNPPLRRAYLDLIAWSGFVALEPIGRDILIESARLRVAHESAHRKLKLPDATHLVTAIQKQCRYFLSADEGITPPVEMTKIGPDASGAGEILQALA